MQTRFAVLVCLVASAVAFQPMGGSSLALKSASASAVCRAGVFPPSALVLAVPPHT